MADEPRRSGRATKGQHTKNQDAPEAHQKSKGKKGKFKAGKQASSEPTPEGDGEEDNSVIRCLCGAEEDEGGYRMICCDNCEVWQHNICMGLPEEEHLQPDSYFCEQCKPANHKELLAAMDRGEKPWEERMRQREEEEKKAKRNRGKKGKGGAKKARPSQAASEAVEEPPAAVDQIAETEEDSKKRKFSEVESPNEKTVVGSDLSNDERAIRVAKGNLTDCVKDIPERSVRRASESAKESRRRSSGIKAESPTVPQHDQPDTQTELVQEVKQLPKERRAVGDALLKVIADQIRQTSRQGNYRIPDGQTADSLGNHHALRIEHSLFMNHCGTSSAPTQAYKNQFREINANLKRNPTLLSRILQESLAPDELSTMSSTDMATEERQKELAAIKEQNEKQATLVEEQKPRMRKTHKGDELIEDDGQADSVYAPPPPARRNTEDVAMGNTSDSQISPIAQEHPSSGPQRPPPVDTTAAPQHRRDSSNFNINNVWSSVQSPTEQGRLLSQPPRRRSSGVPRKSNGTPRGTQQSVDDPEIDRMLRDEPDDEAYSPADTSGPMGLWRGDVHMSSVARFPVVATHVAGAELSEFQPYTSLLPRLLEVDGRLAKNVADKYLCDLQHSKTSDVSVLNLGLASHDPAAKAEFDKLFDYFHERDRYAVVGKPGHDIVRDIYISPAEAGMGTLPPHLTLLEVNNIEQPLPGRMLLVTIVVKRVDAGQNQTPIAQRAGEASPVNAGLGSTPQAVPGASQVLIANRGSLPPYGSPIPPTAQQTPPPAHAHPETATTQPPYPFTMQGQERAFRVLGPELFRAPVVANLLGVTPDISEEQLANLKDLFEKNPETRESIEALGKVLKAKNEAEGQHGSAQI